MKTDKCRLLCLCICPFPFYGQGIVAFCMSSLCAASLPHPHSSYSLIICFTPFTLRSFLISCSSFDVSSTFTTRLPRNSPSLLSMFMLRIMMFSSFDIMLVMLFTMPMSSFPIIFSVIEYCDLPFPLHIAFTTL